MQLTGFLLLDISNIVTSKSKKFYLITAEYTSDKLHSI